MLVTTQVPKRPVKGGPGRKKRLLQQPFRLGRWRDCHGGPPSSNIFLASLLLLAD